MEVVVLFKYGLELFQFLYFGSHLLILGGSKMAKFLVFESDQLNGTLQKVALLLVTLILLLQTMNHFLKGFIFVVCEIE